MKKVQQLDFPLIRTILLFITVLHDRVLPINAN